MKKIKTKQDFLEFIVDHFACYQAKMWVEKLPNHFSAEDVWLAIDRVDWMDWLLNYNRVRLPPAKTRKALRWHLVQTSLEALGAEYVQHFRINRPLVDKDRTSAVLDTLQSVSWEDRGRNCPNPEAFDVLENALREIESGDPWVSIPCDYDLTLPHIAELGQRYVEDVRHVISWDDYCKWARGY